MGFGHRIYKVRDPRADVLKAHRRHAAGDRGPAGLRRRGREGRHRRAAQAQARPAARHQRRVLHRAAARGARGAAQRLHRAVRGRPHRRLVRPRLRAGEGRPHHPPAVELCRAAPLSAASSTHGRAAPGAGARAGGVEHPDDHVGAGRREAGGEVAAPEAAVGMAEQRLGAERVGPHGQRRRARRGLGLGAEASKATPSISGPKRSVSPLLGGLHRPAVDAQPDRRRRRPSARMAK